MRFSCSGPLAGGVSPSKDLINYQVRKCGIGGKLLCFAAVPQSICLTVTVVFPVEKLLLVEVRGRDGRAGGTGSDGGGGRQRGKGGVSAGDSGSGFVARTWTTTDGKSLTNVLATWSVRTSPSWRRSEPRWD